MKKEKKRSKKLYRCEHCNSINERDYIKLRKHSNESEEIKSEYKALCLKCREMMTVSDETLISQREFEQLSPELIVYRLESRKRLVREIPEIDDSVESYVESNNDERVYRIFWKLTDENDPTKKKRKKIYSENLFTLDDVQRLVDSLKSVSKRSRIRPKLKYECVLN
jgi:hypothetical protein